MPAVIGIDTGGTYTDAVLLDMEKGVILKTAKALTTPKDLSVGIVNCLRTLLGNETPEISKIMLSTTLATNAIVEDNRQPVGLICIGKLPHGILPTEEVRLVRGKVDVKGREAGAVDVNEIEKAVGELSQRTNAIAVSGFLSVRNPAQEMKVREIICRKTNLPVVCGYELATELGFYERTVTAVWNAGLLPLIADFLSSIRVAMHQLAIDARVFILRGDGSVVEAAAVLKRPVETILSGPAASVAGAQYLTKAEDGIVADMGGTTTDTALLKGGLSPISERGARIGGWQTMVRSLDIRTLGLGGDSRIEVRSADDISIGPKSAIPSCRGGEALTPTDILHYTRAFDYGDGKASVAKIREVALSAGMSADDLVSAASHAIVKRIHDACTIPNVERELPVIGLGAPAAAWFEKWQAEYKTSLIIPKHYEVANAVGAAVATVREEETAILRRGEEGCGYIVHMRTCRAAFDEKEDALEFAIEFSKKEVYERAMAHGADLIELSIEWEDVSVGGPGKDGVYVETIIHAAAVERPMGR